VTGEGDDLQDAVARAIVQHGIGLKELSTRPSTLPPRGGGGRPSGRRGGR
jgi:hypothetical protein